jgi:DnaJ-class molecular chaperone
MEEEYILWNPSLGIHIFVTIDQTKQSDDNTTVWLDEPYDMVGPLKFSELQEQGSIHFAECYIISKQKWKDDYATFMQEGLRKQNQTRQRHSQDIQDYNHRKDQDQQKYRELLNLPKKGELSINQIKRAFWVVSKEVHPDLGGSDEEFIKITEAKEYLIEVFSS